MRTHRPSQTDIMGAVHQLGLRLPTTVADVIAAHRDLAKKHHPDRYRLASDKAAATETMKRLNQARALLVEHLDDFLRTHPFQWSRCQCVACCAAYEDLWPMDPRD